MEIIHHRGKAFDVLLIITGTFLMAAAVNMVYGPMEMVTGGLSGLAIVVQSVTEELSGGRGVPIWLTNTILNIPIFLTAWWLVGKEFVLKTLFGAVAFSIALYLVPEYNLCGEDYLLATVFGAVLTGGGVGFVFLASSSTGGTDMLSVTLHRFFRHYTLPQILMIVDGSIVAAGALLFGIRSALYAVIAVYITTKVSDTILDGTKFAKLVYIISDSYEEMAEEIMTKLNRGATGIAIKGMYTKQDKHMLFCVVSKKEIVQIKEIVREIDTNAFVIVNDVKEAVGEGFIEYKQETKRKL